MNYLCQMIVAVGLQILVCVPTILAAEPPQSPSELAKAKSIRAAPVTFVLVERRDFRLLFCSLDVLQSRIKREVCIVDDISAGPREVQIGSGQTVEEVLGKVGKQPGHMQIRLVTMNTIEQTPLTTASGELLRRRVQPGDILIVAART